MDFIYVVFLYFLLVRNFFFYQKKSTLTSTNATPTATLTVEAPIIS